MAVRDRGVNIVSVPFKLHYKYTVILFLVFSFYLGLEFMPPVCKFGSELDMKTCWKSGLWSTVDGRAMPKNTNASSLEGSTALREVPILYHLSFLFLLGQSVFFYIPYQAWKYYDDGYLASFFKSLIVNLFDGGAATRFRKATEIFLRRERGYFFYYMLMQFMNLVNVVNQMSLIGYLYGFNFPLYGLKWFSSDGEVVFPMIAYCKAPGIETDGHVDNFGTCIVSSNKTNDKVYLVIWAWLMFLALATLLELAVGFLMVLGSPALKKRILEIIYWARYGELFAVEVNYVFRNFEGGDYLLLFFISQNRHLIDKRQFLHLLKCINQVLFLKEQLDNSSESDEETMRIQQVMMPNSRRTTRSAMRFNETGR